jgi:hypothetical protein
MKRVAPPPAFAAAMNVMQKALSEHEWEKPHTGLAQEIARQ